MYVCMYVLRIYELSTNETQYHYVYMYALQMYVYTCVCMICMYVCIV